MVATPRPLQCLGFDLSDSGDGVTTLEALASTAIEAHAAVLAEVDQVLTWAWREFPNSHGPVDEGHDWDHDLQIGIEDDRWFSVALTLTASPAFVAAFLANFGGGAAQD